MPVPGHPPKTCPHPLPSADDLRVRFPGGATLQIPSTPLPNPGDQVAKLLGLVNAALAPLMPILDLVDAMLAAAKVFDAVKSLNPVKIAEALVDLLKIVDRLKTLIPPVSAPFLVKDVVRAIRIYVADIVSQLELIVAQQSRIQIAQEKAATVPELAQHVACAQATVDVTFSSMKTAAAPVNRLLRVVNLLCEMAGLPKVPGLDFGADPAAAVAPLQTLVAALQTLEDAIPG